jgi:hypothetical protein
MSFPIQPSVAACRAVQVTCGGLESVYPPPLPIHTPLGYLAAIAIHSRAPASRRNETVLFSWPGKSSA